MRGLGHDPLTGGDRGCGRRRAQWPFGGSCSRPAMGERSRRRSSPTPFLPVVETTHVRGIGRRRGRRQALLDGYTPRLREPSGKRWGVSRHVVVCGRPGAVRGRPARFGWRSSALSCWVGPRRRRRAGARRRRMRATRASRPHTNAAARARDAARVSCCASHRPRLAGVVPATCSCGGLAPRSLPPGPRRPSRSRRSRPGTRRS